MKTCTTFDSLTSNSVSFFVSANFIEAIEISHQINDPNTVEQSGQLFIYLFKKRKSHTTCNLVPLFYFFINKAGGGVAGKDLFDTPDTRACRSTRPKPHQSSKPKCALLIHRPHRLSAALSISVVRHTVTPLPTPVRRRAVEGEDEQGQLQPGHSIDSSRLPTAGI
jgi:hypothetical protein